MKKLIFFFSLLSIFFGLSAQDITISFQPKVSGTTIDSILVTNLRTNQKVKLLGSESLSLTKVTGVNSLPLPNENGLLFPNPCNGRAELIFYTSLNQQVEVRVFNISGQLLSTERQFLSSGQHRFDVNFPKAGIYNLIILKDDGALSYKAICIQTNVSDCSIRYTETENHNPAKNALAGKTLNYVQGDILHCSAFSSKNNTIIAGTPTASKVYSVEFYECIDPDKQSYPIVKIGDQWWMAKNLALLPSVSPRSVGSITAPYYYVYDYSGTDVSAAKNNSNYSTYGVLYNWPAALTACPAGWHLPSDAEWTILTTYLGGGSVAGGKMKETGTTHWYDPNEGATNESSFSALPGGYRNDNSTFSNIVYHGYWWSSTEYSITDAWNRYVLFYLTTVYRYNYYKESGFSVRCIKN